MENITTRYLRLFVEWVTASREKYRSDFFFRTTINIIALQVGLVSLCILAFWWAIQYTNGQILSTTSSGIQELMVNYPNYQPTQILSNISALQGQSVWYVFGGVVIITIVFGILLARFTLRPARNTLYYQKLFISNIAHELRTPLSTIKTSTEVALLDEMLAPPLRKTLGEIVGELDRVSEIINNLLSLNTLTRPERMQFHNVDLGPIIDMIIARHSALARERNINIILKKDRYCTVSGNATALEQVITNLVKNALSYTPKSSSGVVIISVFPDYHGAVVLSVSDNGIGISQADLFHIFEPFYRADTSRVRNVKKGGTGLGLTIVNEIVRVHHGKIHIQSARGKGTTVSISLPAGVSPSDTASGEENKDHSEISVDFSKGFSLNHQIVPAVAKR